MASTRPAFRHGECRRHAPWNARREGRLALDGNQSERKIVVANKKLTGKKDLTVGDLEKIADTFGMTLFQLTTALLQPIDSITKFHV